jgi:hypothetical protein
MKASNVIICSCIYVYDAEVASGDITYTVPSKRFRIILGGNDGAELPLILTEIGHVL